jgi:hypothetical protein
MKSNRSFMLISLVALVVVSLAVASPAAAQRRGAGSGGGECTGGIGALFNEIDIVPLTGEEAELLYLWEEEKLARDVYLALAETWQLPIFANIAVAEQRHMDLVYMLIETYGFSDQIPEDIVGTFLDPNLGLLYPTLVAKGSNSLIEALFVGAEIEDMDLADLYELIESGTDNRHVELVAYNLAKGSRNHLRAFVRALNAQDQIHTPSYLNQDTFDEIIAAGMEQRLFYNADGEPVPACGGSVGGFGMRRGQVRRGGQGNGGQNGTGTGEDDGSGSANGGCDGNGPHGGGNGSGNNSGS